MSRRIEGDICPNYRSPMLFLPVKSKSNVGLSPSVVTGKNVDVLISNRDKLVLKNSVKYLNIAST